MINSSNSTSTRLGIIGTMVAVTLAFCARACKTNAFSTLIIKGTTKTPSSLAAAAAVSAETATNMEDVVRKYFDGVNKKDPEQIKSCFNEKATIRDVCGINDTKRDVVAQDLADRCMEFLAAHPDCKVDFHYGPECGRNSRWVVAHWYETGTWSGQSCGLKPTNEPMKVEGQTRFLVNDELKIVDMVVTRTFTDWENAMLAKRAQEEKTSK